VELIGKTILTAKIAKTAKKNLYKGQQFTFKQGLVVLSLNIKSNRIYVGRVSKSDKNPAGFQSRPTSHPNPQQTLN
jgi:hypothetical protein